MLTGKQRAELRGQANGLEPIFQIGKNGLTDAFKLQLEDAILKRELMKIKILRESSPVDARTAADEIAIYLRADVVQVIGNIVVLYRYNPELHQPEPKKKPAAPAKKKTYRVAAKPTDSRKSPFGEKKSSFGAKKSSYGEKKSSFGEKRKSFSDGKPGNRHGTGRRGSR